MLRFELISESKFVTIIYMMDEINVHAVNSGLI